MAETPDVLSNRPDSPSADLADPISEHLDAVHVSGGVFFHAELAAPFSLELPPCDEIAQMLALGGRRVVPFHIVATGTAEVRVDGLDPVPFATGDVGVFLHGGAHAMASPGARGSTPLASLLPPPPYYGRLQAVRGGGCGAVTQIVCGFLFHERTRWNPLLDMLPPFLKVSTVAADSAAPLPQVLRLIEDEISHPRPGGASLLARLTELMLVEALRDYLTTHVGSRSDWCSAFQDSFVVQTLRLFHSGTDRPWDLETLCSEVNLSRSALTRRFTSAMGQPPMRYLTRLRIQRATDLLRDTDLTVSDVATRVGYSSEGTFNRAFRRTVGRPPGAWRRRPTPLPPLPPTP